MLKAQHLLYIALILSFTACTATKKKTNSPYIYGDMTSEDLSMTLDTLFANADGISERETYNPSATRLNDLLHTAIAIRFNWDSVHAYGQATITAKPYFYPTNTIELDARGFVIHEVSLLKGKTKQALDYSYESDVMKIQLDKTYTREETYQLYIDYTAKPNELKQGGSNAISSDKGLFFINPDGKEKDKPQQIWTQGETQSNSAWFPTIDRPNERMTHEIAITVQDRFVTLSNGDLVKQTKNADGTRTDFWKMDQPHAPYLVMMAIGEYAIVKDQWRKIPLTYYVEKEYEEHAKAIFGATPEMMEFFSTRLGVDYPWSKYGQVVVRDYVSGAMENTSATVFGEFVQATKRELIDGNYEGIVAHELFHHWFGDLVTCESWANLPLNESFATYGEYLWDEYKYGRETADHGGRKSMDGYLQDAKRKQADLIRFDYEDKEEMFDGHSYNKGGRVLHMLRKYVGDDAFFNSLKLYLEKNKYTAVEIHNLRLAFEEITGEDLNWFFNQWFLASGHPSLLINHSYDADKKEYKLEVSQQQNLNTTPLYKLPLDVDIYVAGKIDRKRIVLDTPEDEFIFPLDAQPDWVSFDAEKMLLCEKEENMPLSMRIKQFRMGEMYLDRYEALQNLAEENERPEVRALILEALDDRYWGIRAKAISLLQLIAEDANKEEIKKKLTVLSVADEEPYIRSTSINYLASNYDDKSLMPVYEKALEDSSYSVVSGGLAALAKADTSKGMKLAKQFELEENSNIRHEVATIYSLYGGDEQDAYFKKYYESISGYQKISFANLYIDFLQRRSPATITAGLQILEDIAINDQNKWIRFYGQKSLMELKEQLAAKEEQASEENKIAYSELVNNIELILKKAE